MPVKIRRNVYETNSSSTHSITVSDGADFDSISPDDDGNIVIKGEGEYGWEVRSYQDAPTRLDYISIYARDWAGTKKDEFLEMIKSVVEQHTGAKVVFDFSESKDSLERGYIDHQSVESQDYHHLFDAATDQLKRFIFGSESVLNTDNDNH